MKLFSLEGLVVEGCVKTVNILLQEDVYNGSSVADVLVRRGKASDDVLTVAVCLVANLAVDEMSQVISYLNKIMFKRTQSLSNASL